MENLISQTVNDKPDIKYLNRYVKPYVCGACDKNPEVWKVLGIELLGQESETALNTISAESRGSVVACCSGMFSLWLERQPEASWRQLIDALIDVKLVSLAAEIKRSLILPEQQKSSQEISADLQESVVKNFSEPISIQTAYGRLFVHLSKAFASVDLSTLQMALICQGNTPKSVELNKTVEKEILAVTSHQNLMYILNSCCNWLNIQLFEIMAHVCAFEVPIAVRICERYKEVVFSKNLREALPYFVSKHELPGREEEKYITAVCVKAHKNPALITIKEFIEWDWKTKDVILKDLLAKAPSVQHIKEGCLEVYFSISTHYDFDAYKMALCNRHQLYTVDVIHVEIGKHPLVYNFWSFNLNRKFTLQYHYEGILQLCHILLDDDKSMDGIISVFHSHKLISDDDAGTLQHFALNKYLQKQFLLKHLQNLKLPDWLAVCNILLKVKTMEQTSHQLINVFKGKFPHIVHPSENVLQQTDKSFVNILRRETADDCVLSRKPQSSIMSLLVYSLDHVKHINPSEVESEFHYITGHVIEILSHCHPTLLIERCRQLMASEVHKIKLFQIDYIQRLRNLKTSPAALKMLSVFWSWSNHSILTFLAEFSELAVTLLEEFESKLVLSYPITHYPFLSAMEIPCDDNYTTLTLKCKDKLKVTLKLVYDIQSALVEKCEITQYALQLVAVHEDPIELHWMIPFGLVDLVNKNVNDNFQYFAIKGITDILLHPDAKYCIKYDIKTGSLMVLSKEENQSTPLHVAARNGQLSVVECLISSGADINAVNKAHNTPLHLASWKGYDSVIDCLLKGGADVNAFNNVSFLNSALAS